MPVNQNQTKISLSKIFTWIMVAVVVVSVLAGAVSSFLLKPINKANASQISPTITKVPPANGITQTSSSNGTARPVPKVQAPTQ